MLHFQATQILYIRFWFDRILIFINAILLSYQIRIFSIHDVWITFIYIIIRKWSYRKWCLTSGHLFWFIQSLFHRWHLLRPWINSLWFDYVLWVHLIRRDIMDRWCGATTITKLVCFATAICGCATLSWFCLGTIVSFYGGTLNWNSFVRTWI